MTNELLKVIPALLSFLKTPYLTSPNISIPLSYKQQCQLIKSNNREVLDRFCCTLSHPVIHVSSGERKINCGFHLSFTSLTVSGCGPSVCSARVSNERKKGMEMEVTFTLTFFSAFPDTLVAAGECLITSWRWVLLQHLQCWEIMYYDCKGHSEFFPATGEEMLIFISIVFKFVHKLHAIQKRTRKVQTAASHTQRYMRWRILEQQQVIKA